MQDFSRRSVLSQAVTGSALAAVASLSLGLLAAPAASAADREQHRELDKHPKIRAAWEALRSAREELASAQEDFHGHKGDALQAVDAAIRQLQILVDQEGH